MSESFLARPWLLLPIETKHRELYGKVLLSLAAAERGFEVLLGEQNAMLSQLNNLPQGIYLDKSVGRTKTKYFQKLNARDCQIVAWCEEGLVYRDRDAYLHERVSGKSLSLANKFFAWGEVQANDIHQHAPEAAAKIRITGNPRFDILRPEFRSIFTPVANEIRRRYGPYILINSNFSRYNHFMGYDFWIEALKQRGTITSDEQLDFYHRWRDFLGKIFHGFVRVIPLLSSAFPDRTFIVRPHPSEDHKVWLREMAPLNNVTVVHEDSAIPWISGADAVIHNSCTTGLEAYLLGVPVAAFRPVFDETFDSYLPNAVSHEAIDGEGLVETLYALLTGSLPPIPCAQSEVGRYVAALDGPIAADRVADALKEIRLHGEPHKMGPLLSVRIAQVNIMSALKPVLRQLQRRHMATSYANQKFPGIQLSEIECVITQLKEASGRFGGITVTGSPYRHCFQIHKA